MTKTKATRRNFFVKAGTALSLPLAAGASAIEPIAKANSHDDVKAIQELPQALAREINGGTGRAAELFTLGKLPDDLASVTRLMPADFGEHDAIKFASDRRTAYITLDCIVETQIPIEAEGTLIEMARAQGEGFVRSTRHKVIEIVYVRSGATWKIKSLQ